MKKLLLLLSGAFLFVACEEKMTIKEYMKEDGWTYLKKIEASSYEELYDEKDDETYFIKALEIEGFVFYKELNDKTLFVAIEDTSHDDTALETERTRTNLSRLDRLTVYFDDVSFNIREGVWRYYEAYIEKDYRQYYFNF
ncbi:MAG: hypothetical protein Q4F45_04885 [Alistipes sp.]|nr:hypothetical protein [Alistipes sp.]